VKLLKEKRWQPDSLLIDQRSFWFVHSIFCGPASVTAVKLHAVESKGIPGTRGTRHDHDLPTETGAGRVGR